MATLIKYGYYDDPEDIHEPLEHIFTILREKPGFKLDCISEDKPKGKRSGSGLKSTSVCFIIYRFV